MKLDTLKNKIFILVNYFKFSTENKMKIYRSILLDDNDTIQKEQLGISWSLCCEFAETHAIDINRMLNKDDIIIIEADIDQLLIDWDNTLFSMENRPYEYEVVLYPRVDVIVQSHDYSEKEIERFLGNTGPARDFEDYCEKYEGELTKEAFLNLANEF